MTKFLTIAAIAIALAGLSACASKKDTMHSSSMSHTSSGYSK